MNKLKIETVLERIEKECIEQNSTFCGFFNKNREESTYIGKENTYLKIQCNKCKKTRFILYKNFVNLHNKCKSCSHKLTLKEFIKKAKEIHGDRYIYDKVNYVDAHTPITIICQTHGEFPQIPNDHLSGKGCKYCNNRSWRYTQEEIIFKFKEIYGDKYDYSEVKYVNIFTPITIICHKKDKHGKEHGKFTLTPHEHLNGIGCDKCKPNFKLEEEMRLFLKNEQFEYQKKFEWLGKQSLDFYLPQYNCAIECQGIQHFNPIEHFGGEEGYKLQQERDQRKRKLCEEYGIRLLYYSNLGIDYPYKVFENKEDLLEEIKRV